jgi:phage terminase large subunit
VLLIRGRIAQKRIGCFREFQNSIAESSHQLLADLIHRYGLSEYKVTDNAIINKVTGTDFLFKGLRHNEQSIKSIEGIDIAWVEEAQTISNSSLEVLTPTIRKPGSQIIYTYNRLRQEDPVHKRLVIDGRPNTLILNFNYDIALKYGMMPEAIRLEMENDKQFRPNLYRHKWLGEPNNLEDRIFKDWKIIDEIPHEARLEVGGGDFGFARDKTAFCDIYYYNGGFIIDEIVSRVGLRDTDLGNLLLNRPNPNLLYIADSADIQKVIMLQEMGVNITGVIKRAGGSKSFTNAAISFVQDQQISITRRSKNYIKSYNDFMWQTDRDGNIVPTYDHYMSDEMMSVVYGMTNFDSSRHRSEEQEITTTGNFASTW